MRIRRALLSLASTASALGIPASAGAAPPLGAATDGLTDAQQVGIALLLLLAITVALGLRTDGRRRAEAAKRNPAPPEPAPAPTPEEVLVRRAAIRVAMTHVLRPPPPRS